MSSILATKLYRPPQRPGVVVRPRLLARLDDGLHARLTLLSAPAGFGKTTLVSAWLAGCGQAAAWLALDGEENDPARFLTYVIAAIQTIVPTVGVGTLALLQSSQPPAPEALLTALLNDLAAIPESFILALDDYHVIESAQVDAALTYLLEHLPPQMHLVIATREDPRLPLARLRAQGQLVELRAADLRFTAEEAAAFLQRQAEPHLSAADIAALANRTEGWIAGLQLAALSLRGQPDASSFIQAFAGTHRYIVDYLVEEVLRRQPEATRRFLLQTAILDRLTGPLCDAVTGQEGSGERLEALERGNFFVVPLDDQRRWYRYHHLFADVLAAHLAAEQPDQLATLHRRASAWHEQHGAPASAIYHTLAAGDAEHAADLIELAIPDVRRNRQDALLIGWLKALPDPLLRARPVLSLGYAWALLDSGQLEEVEARLRDAERALQVPTARVAVDQEEARRLPALIAVYRAGYAQIMGDVPGVMRYAQQMLDLSPEDDHLAHGAAAALLGLAYWTSGELEAAHRTFAMGIASVRRAGNVSDAVNGAMALADIRVAQGRLHEAMRTYEQALQLAAVPGEPGLRGTADVHVGMSELCREQGDLAAATAHLLHSQEWGERTGLPYNRSRWCTAMAQLRRAEGDLDGALALLHEAERLYTRDFFPNVRPVGALLARVWLTQGRLGEARGWAREQGLAATDDLSYLREFAHITLARVLLAEYARDHSEQTWREATELLGRLLQAAEAGERMGCALEILVVQALAHQAHGDIAAALVPLAHALALAEPEGYVRLFVDEGVPMAALLAAAANRGIAAQYTHRLLAALGSTESAAPAQQALLEPLSERELEVLRLLGTDLSGPEIASQLVISLNTLHTHTKNIYGKLGVNTRRAAVRLAAELALL